MTSINLDDLSLKELKTLQKEVTKTIDDFQARQRRDALAAVEAKAKEMGFSLAELTGAASKKPKSVSVAKYQHPENAALTWTGRGRQPLWIKEAEAAGTSRDAFLIDK